MSAIRDWLEQHGLEAYAKAFADSAIDLDVLTALTDEDLRGLGMPLGDRKRFARAVADRTNPLPQQLLDNLPGLVAYVTPDERYAYVNAMFEDWYGKPVDQIVGRSAGEIVSAISYRQVKPHFKTVMSGKAVSFEVDTVLPDGRQRWSRVQLIPDLDARGQTRGAICMVSDLTELRDMTRRLEESEKRYRELIDGALHGIVINDEGIRPIFANQACADLLGYDTPDELLALDSISSIVVDPETEGRLEQRLWRRLAGEVVPANVEFQARRKDGSTIWLLGQSRMINWMGRKAVQTTLTDITARREAEDKLRQQSAVHKMLIDSVPAFVSLKDREGRYLYVNRRLAEFFGIASDNFIGLTMAELVGPSEPDQMRSLAQQVVATGEPIINHELTFVRVPGRVHSVTILPVKFVAGEVEEVLSISLDVTEQKRVERELRESELRLIEAQRIGNMGSWERDVTRNRLIWSEQVYRIFGVDPETFHVTHESFVACIHPDDVAEYRRAAALGYAGEAPFDVEHRIVQPDGEIRTVREVGEYVRDDEGNVLRVIGIVQDVTGLRRLEDRVREGEKLQAIGLLAGGIAHEFNNMMQVIQGNVELLADSIGDDAVSRRRLLAMERTAEYGADLTNRLLAFSRRRPLRPERVDIGMLIEDVTELLGQTLGERYEFVVDLAPGEWPIDVDPGELQNAIVNLVVNARDAMPDGGRIVLDGGIVSKSADAMPPEDHLSAGNFLRLSVTDTGSGMSSAVQSQAFEPFFTTKAVGEGTGLGLSMVYGFAKQSGGFAEIESRVGEATTVSIYLPQVEAPVTEDDTGLDHERAEEEQPSAYILIVEDNELVRSALSDALSSHGYRIHAVDSGTEALRYLSDGSPVDLVISDVVLAGDVDGVVLAGRLRSDWPHISILFVSGRTDIEARLDTELRHSVPLLRKPFRVTDLLAAVDAALSRPELGHDSTAGGATSGPVPSYSTSPRR